MLGLALLFVGGFALLMMHITQAVPDSRPWRHGSMRHEDERAFRLWWYAYAAVAGAGLLMFLAGLLF
jgi:hypothetical protein